MCGEVNGQVVFLQRGVIDFVQRQEHYNRYGGVDHLFDLHHPNAMSLMRHLLNSSIFIVSSPILPVTKLRLATR
jgi:hypothetical protein